jgi:hypothetical protein
MSTVFDVCAELAGMLETTAANREDSHAKPFEDNYKAGILYIWPRTERFPSIDTGGTDQHSFDIRVAWATQAERELSSQSRSSSVSDTLSDKVEAFATTLRGLNPTRKGTTFDWIEIVGVDWESLATKTVRGFFMDLSGYVVESP